MTRSPALHPTLQAIVGIGAMSEAEARELGPAPAGELTDEQFAVMRRALTRHATRLAEPEAAPRGLPPILQQAIAAGVMSEAQARDVDAMADGLIARRRAGELTAEQANDVVVNTAIRDGLAERRARELAPRLTVPWVPEADGEEISGRALRAVRLAAQWAIERGWSAETLRSASRWHEDSVAAALVRTAVLMGLIP